VGLKPRASTQSLFPESDEAATRNQNAAPKSVGAYVLLFFVRCYMILLSPFFGGACKFQPSCSNYAYEAIALHGARRGTLLAIQRLLRCRPFTVGGFDPVPEPDEQPAQEGETGPSGANTPHESVGMISERKLRLSRSPRFLAHFEHQRATGDEREPIQ
jgi:uncharacterized protein